ncbi:MAG: hypothetical protein FWF92_03895 [Oscillospiraceae bacterium]|nr:hypothetical protein [Oscillospiraceae bacterium]
MKNMKNIICSYKIDDEIEKNLINLSINPVKLRGFEKLNKSNPLNYHPDMLCFNLDKNKWIFYEKIYKINKSIIDKLNFEIIIADNPKLYQYPYDIGLNAVMFGDYLIGNVKYINKNILEYAKKTNKKIIDVKQGYTKCSVCIVDENSIITSDESIYKKAIENNINVLLIKKGHIDLDSYEYGFIGGCSGLIDKNKLVFTGDITLHPNYKDIKSFCDNRKVEIISLSKKKLYDYGSLLCI